MTGIREAIDQTIGSLRTLIEQAVRHEQLRHQLTGLPNASALDERLQRAIDVGHAFWLAFIEIDRFKRVNDEFGYERANALLQEVAKSLEQAAPSYFAAQAIAFHAHGDEFYALGDMSQTPFTTDELSAKLDAIRDRIGHISLSAGKGVRPMTCSVSIGWVESGEGTAREYMDRVELAVGHAKRSGRNRVVQYVETMGKTQSVSLRSDCAGCQTVFTLDVPIGAIREEDIYCPNCGCRSARPPQGLRAPAPQDISDLASPPSASSAG